MDDLSKKSLTRTPRAWLVWLCLVLFTFSCFAESVHCHPNSDRTGQHCSICIAAHSVARPAQITSPVATPVRCFDAVFVGGLLLPESRSVLSFHIRPPPVA